MADIPRYTARELNMARRLAPYIAETYSKLNLHHLDISPRAISAGILEEWHDRTKSHSALS